MLFSLYLLAISFPLLLSFLVPILTLNKVYTTFDSKEDRYKWLAIYSTIPPLIIYLHFLLISLETLAISEVIMLFAPIYLFSVFTIWLSMPKPKINMLLETIVWILRAGLILIFLCFSLLLFTVLSFPMQD